ncbi:MAG TPA: hypothetical protein VMV56_00255 [Williamwhitmania sp.]|nr:hypothetical protein [Williamwhitmania sp.]
MGNTVFANDMVMEKLRLSHTLKQFKPSTDIYFDLLRSIVSQQLSGKIADLIFGRFLDLFPQRCPTPNLVLAIEVERFRSAGLSNGKANYVKNVARFALESGLQLDKISAMDDKALLEYLTTIKGVGRWTAEMILIFSLNRQDVFPIDDLAIRQSMVELYNIDSDSKSLRENLTSIAELWRPNRTLASLLLWAWKDGKKLR